MPKQQWNNNFYKIYYGQFLNNSYMFIILSYTTAYYYFLHR